MRDGTRGWMHGDHLTPADPAAVSATRAVASADPRPDRTEAPPSEVPGTRSAFTDAVGRAAITDGDTIRIGDTRIRLQGIDAPESGQACEDAAGTLYPCGGRAANALDALIAGRTVACRRDDTDRYGRMVGTCAVLATGEDLNAAMVGAGWALAYRQYSTAYVDHEAAARAARRGLWQGRFVPPGDYRAGERLARESPRSSDSGSASAAASGASGSCLIKGNISDSGRIYHVPGSRWYEKTRIDAGRGERWFCSVGEAQAAGWRAPRG